MASPPLLPVPRGVIELLRDSFDAKVEALVFPGRGGEKGEEPVLVLGEGTFVLKPKLNESSADGVLGMEICKILTNTLRYI